MNEIDQTQLSYATNGIMILGVLYNLLLLFDGNLESRNTARLLPGLD